MDQRDPNVIFNNNEQNHTAARPEAYEDWQRLCSDKNISNATGIGVSPQLTARSDAKHDQLIY